MELRYWEFLPLHKESGVLVMGGYRVDQGFLTDSNVKDAR